jgi:hypothetical protein
MTIAYVYGLGTTIELAENFRYRFLTESLFWVTAFNAEHEYEKTLDHHLPGLMLLLSAKFSAKKRRSSRSPFSSLHRV